LLDNPKTIERLGLLSQPLFDSGKIFLKKVKNYVKSVDKKISLDYNNLCKQKEVEKISRVYRINSRKEMV